jgi:hypothetical protein
MAVGNYTLICLKLRLLDPAILAVPSVWPRKYRALPCHFNGFGARISAWRHFKGCGADVYRGYHGGLSCHSSLTPRAVITFLVSGIE